MRTLILGSATLKLGYTAVSILCGIFLARALGPTSFGVYSLALAVTSLLFVPAQVGLPQLIVRETAKAADRADWHVVVSLLKWANRFTFSAWAVVSMATLVILLLYPGLSGASLETLLWALVLGGVAIMINLRGATLRGLSSIIAGQFPEKIVRPSAFLVLIGISTWLVGEGALEPAHAMAMHVAAALMALLMAMIFLRRSRIRHGIHRLRGASASGRWLKSLVPLSASGMLIAAMSSIDIIMLGWFVEEADLGIYKVATQAALLFVFGIQVANIVFAPRFASMWQSGDKAGVRHLLRRSGQLSILIVIPVLLVFSIYSDEIVRLVFGEDYLRATWSILILGAGKGVASMFGSLAVVLSMTGHERSVISRSGVTLVVHIALNLLLIPKFGIEGAAVATAIAFFLQAVLLWISAKFALQGGSHDGP